MASLRTYIDRINQDLAPKLAGARRDLGNMRRHLDDEISFFKGFAANPRAVGSIIPTSGFTARRMASVIDPHSGLPVLELGPGTGVVTRAIRARGVGPADLVAVEYSADFVRHLRRLFPAVDIRHGDAFDLDAALSDRAGQKFDAVISAVPMLNFQPVDRVRLVEDFLDRIPEGRPVVQITYGPLSPIPPGRGSFSVRHLAFEIRNIPPAQLWVYRRPAKRPIGAA